MKVRIVLGERQVKYHAMAGRAVAGGCLALVLAGCVFAAVKDRIAAPKATSVKAKMAVQPAPVVAPAVAAAVIAATEPVAADVVKAPETPKVVPPPVPVLTPAPEAKAQPAVPHAKEVNAAGDRCRLLPMGSIIILATEPAALELLLEDSARMRELIGAGSLFTLRPDTTAEVLVVAGDLVQIKVLDGPQSGRTGWVPQRLTRMIAAPRTAAE